MLSLLEFLHLYIEPHKLMGVFQGSVYWNSISNQYCMCSLLTGCWEAQQDGISIIIEMKKLTAPLLLLYQSQMIICTLEKLNNVINTPTIPSSTFIILNRKFTNETWNINDFWISLSTACHLLYLLSWILLVWFIIESCYSC